jgi:hypothetical protein
MSKIVTNVLGLAMASIPSAGAAYLLARFYAGRSNTEALVDVAATMAGIYAGSFIKTPATPSKVHTAEVLAAQGAFLFLNDYFNYGHEDVLTAGVITAGTLAAGYAAANVQIGNSGQTLDSMIMFAFAGAQGAANAY